MLEDWDLFYTQVLQRGQLILVPVTNENITLFKLNYCQEVTTKKGLLKINKHCVGCLYQTIKKRDKSEANISCSDVITWKQQCKGGEIFGSVKDPIEVRVVNLKFTTFSKFARSIVWDMLHLRCFYYLARFSHEEIFKYQKYIMIHIVQSWTNSQKLKSN